LVPLRRSIINPPWVSLLLVLPSVGVPVGVSVGLTNQSLVRDPIRVRNRWSLSVVSLVGDSLGVSVFIGVGFPAGVFDDVAIGISSSLESVLSLSALNRALFDKTVARSKRARQARWATRKQAVSGAAAVIESSACSLGCANKQLAERTSPEQGDIGHRRRSVALDKRHLFRIEPL